MLSVEQKLLKGVLMMRRLGNKSQSMEEQMEEQKRWLKEDPSYADRLDEWIDSLREDLAKTPEQLEEESRLLIEEMSEYEWMQAESELASMRHVRDEWDDLWDDRARSVGAILF